MIDRELLARARAAATRLGEAERGTQLARAEYHTAVRRLHLAGGSLREIAAAMELSHQRVQQIVDRAGGTWWGRIWRSRNARRDAVCTFCGRPPSEAARLIAGPDVYVCDGCVGRAEAVLAGRGRAGEALRLSDRRSRARCSFCGKRASGERRVVSAGDAGACSECLRTCREILEGSERGG